jgi:amino acid transporter
VSSSSQTAATGSPASADSASNGRGPLFIFWGWDTAATVAEETRDAARTSGRAALLSTVLLLVVFLLVVTAAQAFDGPGQLAAHPADALSALAASVVGNTVGKVVVLASIRTW